MTNNKHFRYYLVFDDKYISFKIAFFETKTEAEHWREFLAYTVQEFKYEEMKIIKVKIIKKGTNKDEYKPNF